MSLARYDVRIWRAAPEARFELAGRPSEIASLLEGARLAVPSAPKAIAAAGGIRVAWIGPRRIVVAAAMARHIDLAARLRLVSLGLATGVAVDVTGATATFIVEGRGALDILAQGVVHDLHPTTFPTDTVLATEAWGTAIILEHVVDQATALRLTTDVALAGYIESWLMAAAGLRSGAVPGIMAAPPPEIKMSD